MTPVGVDLLSLNALVVLRIGESDSEYASRIEDLDEQTVVVAAPAGASAALLASGIREVHLSWISSRGRYEQRCELAESIAGPLKRWRLRPVGQALLIQRRRYVRVRAAVAVLIALPDEILPATTVDISEGGLRLRMPRREFSEITPIAVHMSRGGGDVEVYGYLLRSFPAPDGQTEAVIAFEAEDRGTDAIRRYVFQMQLRARAAREA